MNQTLPRIIGIKHVHESFEKVKRVIDLLPPQSKIGLEMDEGHPKLLHSLKRNFPLFASLKTEMPKSIFLRIANYAESRGHKIIWLEKPSSFLAGSNWHFKQIEDELKPFEKKGIVEVEKMPIEKLEKINEIEQDWVYNSFALSEWRSKIMRKVIEREKWRESDVTFTGNWHATDLGKELGIEVDRLNNQSKESQESYEQVKKMGEQLQKIRNERKQSLQKH